MILNLPEDIRAEVVAGWLEGENLEVELRGSHWRNAYEDLLSVVREENKTVVRLAKPGLYDILPEALFHPIDRFEGIPANVYKERVAEEIEQQQLEEDKARAYFMAPDRFLFDLGVALSQLKQEEYSGTGMVQSMLADRMPEVFKDNRFVRRMMEYLPRCSRLRGNMSILTLILRRILSDEGLKLKGSGVECEVVDTAPRYACSLGGESIIEDTYLGNAFDEKVLTFHLPYWNAEECDKHLLNFIGEMKVFEEFLNDWFMGIETCLAIDVSTDSMTVRLDSENPRNYLGYNTNL